MVLERPYPIYRLRLNDLRCTDLRLTTYKTAPSLYLKFFLLAVGSVTRTAKIEVAFPASRAVVYINIVAISVRAGIVQRRADIPHIAGRNGADPPLIGGIAETIAGEVAAAHVCPRVTPS